MSRFGGCRAFENETKNKCLRNEINLMPHDDDEWASRGAGGWVVIGGHGPQQIGGDKSGTLLVLLGKIKQFNTFEIIQPTMTE